MGFCGFLVEIGLDLILELRIVSLFVVFSVILDR
jgi:hypothetical protein